MLPRTRQLGDFEGARPPELVRHHGKYLGGFIELTLREIFVTKTTFEDELGIFEWSFSDI